MEDNEDEPEDVRKATPVADDVKSGTKDEKAGNRRDTSKKEEAKKPSHCDKNAKKPTLAKSEADCCRGRIARTPKTPKTMSVLVYSPPCTLPRLEIIPRHCLSKQEYIDILAVPNRKCPSPCLGKTVMRKIRPISTRMNELAQPARRLIVGTLQERAETLPPEMISNLVKSIEGSACMTPEQAEQYFRDKERRKEPKAGKTAGQKCKGKSKRQCPSSLDKEAVMCQYLMAERFVKSILQWRCPIPVEEFQDIANVILRRLGFILEYTPTDGEDLKSQQMRFLADIIACWISGVLFEVAEEHRKEIEEEVMSDEEEEEEEDDEEIEEPKNLGKEPEEDEEEQVEEAIEEEKEKSGESTGDRNGKDDDAGADKAPETSVVGKAEPEDYDDGEKERKEAEEKEMARLEAERKKREEEEKERRKRETEEMARIDAEQMERAAEEKAALDAMREEEEEKRKQAEEEEEAKRKREAEEKKRREEEEEEEKEEEERKRKQREEEEEEEERRKKKQREEEDENRKKKEAEENKKRETEEEERRRREGELKKKKEEEDRLKKIGPKSAIDGIGDGELFRTDLPFVTFGKILDTVYDMLEDEPEGDETDLIHNRIQRALYEKFARLIEAESPGALTETLKDVVDVLSGKAATWVKRLLKDSEVNFMSTNPPEVESKEIRDWGRWIDQVTDRAGDWAEWIHRVVNEAERKSAGNVNRGDWQSWTSDTETNALLWRRYYLETVHQAHHNKMMVADRTVVKTGEKTAYLPAEEEINNTDLTA